MKVLSVCFITASLAMLSGCHSTEPTASTPIQTMQARIVESRLQESPVILRVTGTLHARESATISAQVVGRIEQVLVHEGDNVKAGQTLIVLEDSTQRATLDQAQSAMKAAEHQQVAAQAEASLAASTLARYKQLQAEKSVSPQEMDEVSRRAEAATEHVEALRAQSDAAKAQENGARSMLGYTRLRAPFAGVITARLADPGTLASPGVSLLQIDSAGPLQLQTTVDESAIASIHKGMKVPVAISSAHDSAITGSVAEIVPAADPANHSFMVKIDLPASTSLRAGIYGSAEIITGKHQATLAPRTAIALRGSLACVYVLDGKGIAQLRSITLGAAQGELVEVLSGLSSGEKLVDLPGDRDLAGKRIEAQP